MVAHKRAGIGIVDLDRHIAQAIPLARDQLAGRLIARVEALHIADLEDKTTSPLRLLERIDFGDAIAERLFAEHMATGRQRIGGDFAMPWVGGRDHNRIEPHREKVRCIGTQTTPKRLLNPARTAAEGSLTATSSNRSARARRLGICSTWAIKPPPATPTLRRFSSP